LSLIPEPELKPPLQIFTTLMTKLGCMTSNEINFSQLKEQVKETFDLTVLSDAKTVPVRSVSEL